MLSPFEVFLLYCHNTLSLSFRLVVDQFPVVLERKTVIQPKSGNPSPLTCSVLVSGSFSLPAPTPCPHDCCRHLHLFPPHKQVHLYRFLRLQVHALIQNICFAHSLHSVWPTIGPSASLQMTQFHPFLCLSSIPLCICITFSLFIHLTYPRKNNTLIQTLWHWLIVAMGKGK